MLCFKLNELKKKTINSTKGRISYDKYDRFYAKF